MNNELKRTDYVEIIDDVINSTKKSELEKIETDILKILNEIPNFKSDLYEPLSLAIQMITLKKQEFSSSNQFIINILLASASLITAIVFGIVQVCK